MERQTETAAVNGIMAELFLDAGPINLTPLATTLCQFNKGVVESPMPSGGALLSFPQFMRLETKMILAFADA